MRELAITLGTNFNTIGIAFGFILPTFFVDNEVTDPDTSRRQITMSLIVQGGIGVILMLLTIFTFQNRPKIAPSANA